MAIRKKGRAKFTVRDRNFVWYVHDDQFLRISSEDKKFVVSLPLLGGEPLTVSGAEFPRTDNFTRPFEIDIPQFDASSLGRWAADIVEWSFQR